MNINKALDKAYEGKSFKDLANAPVAALQGVSDNDAKLLKEAFNVSTISDLANLKYVKWAQAIVALAAVEE
jgi:ABC-type amino acid transport substrate-binding protein